MTPKWSCNADPRELAKFSELAHRWWDTESDFRPAPPDQPLRLGLGSTASCAGGKQVVDVGCGRRHPGRRDGAPGSAGLGHRLASKALKVAQLHAIETATPRIEYREVAVEALADEAPGASTPSPAWKCWSTCPIPASVVRACSRLVKPGGWVFFSTINRNAKAFALAIVGAEHVLSLLPKGTHRVREVHPSERAGGVGAGCVPRPGGHDGAAIQPR
jgi:2-polyprenyl-6-hydroxyphenyl methylase/3-demethylubiquinone-9 3-methyltransferase